MVVCVMDWTRDRVVIGWRRVKESEDMVETKDELVLALNKMKTFGNLERQLRIAGEE